MGEPSRLRVAFSGAGARAERWIAAIGGAAEFRRLSETTLEAVDGLVLAPGASDPFTRAKEALLAGAPVLYAASSPLNPWQTAVLTELSHRAGPLLRFAEPFQHRPGFAFLRRLVTGEEPFWRPVYLRTLCLLPANGSTHIDELVLEQLAICGALLDATPQRVVAATGRGSAGEVCSVFLTVHYDDGPLAQCTISLAEAISARQIVAVTHGRTVLLDELDPVAPLRIVGREEPEPRGDAPALTPSWESRGDGSLATNADPVAQEVRSFLDAAARGDGTPANGERWTQVSALSWAARQSMSFGGPMEVRCPALPSSDGASPPLRVIEGGGNGRPSDGRRAALTVLEP